MCYLMLKLCPKTTVKLSMDQHSFTFFLSGTSRACRLLAAPRMCKLLTCTIIVNKLNSGAAHCVQIFCGLHLILCAVSFIVNAFIFSLFFCFIYSANMDGYVPFPFQHEDKSFPFRPTDLIKN